MKKPHNEQDTHAQTVNNSADKKRTADNSDHINKRHTAKSQVINKSDIPVESEGEKGQMIELKLTEDEKLSAQWWRARGYQAGKIGEASNTSPLQCLGLNKIGQFFALKWKEGWKHGFDKWQSTT